MPERLPKGKDESPDALLRAMAGHDANAQLPLVARTRRAIRIADQARREQGRLGRRNVGIALLLCCAVWMIGGFMVQTVREHL